jgi:diphthine synthase
LVDKSLTLFQVYNENSVAIGLARVGGNDQMIVSGTMKELLDVDFGSPLHTLIIPGKMHFLESDMVKTFAINPETYTANAWVD